MIDTRDDLAQPPSGRSTADDGLGPRTGSDANARHESHRPIPFPVPLDIRSLSLTGLFLLALLYTLYFARAFLVPVTLALVLSHLLRPLVRSLKRAGIGEGAGAGLVLAAFLGTIGLGVFQLWGPATRWMAEAPHTLPRMGAKLEKILRPVQKVSQSAEKVVEVADVDGNKILQVEVRGESVAEALFGGTRELLATTLVVALLLFLLLASGDLFLGKVIKVLPRLADKKRAVQIARETQAQVSSYLVTTTLVNVAFGVVIGVAMHLLGMPNPVLWGVVAGVTNFIPFVGALACTAILGAVALLHFESLGEPSRPPGLPVAEPPGRQRCHPEARG